MTYQGCARDSCGRYVSILRYLEFSVLFIESVAKRKACLQPEKTHGYQYHFTVQFFDSYVYRSRINKGH